MKNFIYPAFWLRLSFRISSDDSSDVSTQQEIISFSIDSGVPVLYNQNISSKIEMGQYGTSFMSILVEGAEIEPGVPGSFYLRNYSTDHSTYYSPEFNPNSDYSQVMYFSSNQGSDNVGMAGCPYV